MNEVKLTSEISDGDLCDLLTTAFEGGINYWCDKVVILNNPHGKNYASDVVPHDGTVKLLADEEWHELTKEKLLNGVALYCQEYDEMPKTMMENHDASTANIIVQYAIFNEVVY